MTTTRDWLDESDWRELCALEPRLADLDAEVRSVPFALGLADGCSLEAASARIRSRLRSHVGKQRRRAGDPALFTDEARVAAWGHLESAFLTEWACVLP